MKKAKACFADGGQISKADQLIAEMNAKYGISGNVPPPAPVVHPPVQQPQPAPQQPQQRGLVGNAMQLFGNRGKQIDKAAGYAQGGLIRDAAEYWADDNARFDNSNPSFAGRVIRAVNPLTGFGSAMGAMHTAAGNGDIPGMAMAGISAIPAFGVMRITPASGALKAAAVPSAGRAAGAVSGGAVLNAIADEYQANKPSGYANGGKIEGPGTPTSDSIDARVSETGEPIKVSTKERIVSHDQDAALEVIARRDGYENLDAMLKALTGKPVGPTIKGGKKAAADGWSLDNNPDEYAKAMQEQVLGGNADQRLAKPVDTSSGPTVSDSAGGVYTPELGLNPVSGIVNFFKDSAQAARGDKPYEQIRAERNATHQASPMADSASMASTPSVETTPQNYGNKGRGIASLVTKQNPSTVVDNQFSQNGKDYSVNPTNQQGISKVTAPGVSPLYTNIDPQKAVAGLKDQTIGQPADQEAQGIARIANANKIRGEMIANRDKDIPAGGYAPSILADRSVEDNAALDAMRRSSMISNLSPSQQAEFNMSLSKLALQDKGQNLASDNARYAAEVQDKRAAGHDQVLMRGQDLNAQNEAARISGNPVDNQAKQLSLTQAQKIAQLQDSASAGDTKALSELKMRGIIKSPDDKWELGYRKTKDANTGLETQEPVVVTKDFGKQQQMTPQQEYQNAIASAKGDPAKIKLIQDRARQNGVIK